MTASQDSERWDVSLSWTFVITVARKLGPPCGGEYGARRPAI
jgi:hypothetical protein